MANTLFNEPVRNLKSYIRATRSNAVVKQYIFWSRLYPDRPNPIPFTLVLDTLEPAILQEVSKAIAKAPLPPHMDRQDLLQEAHITLLRSLNNFDLTRSYFLPYLRMALRRALRDKLSQGNRSAQDSLNSVQLPEHPDALAVQPSVSPLTVLSNLLPAQQAKVLYLHLFALLPLKTISATLHLPQSQTSLLLKVSLQALKQALPSQQQISRPLPATLKVQIPSPTLSTPTPPGYKAESLGQPSQSPQRAPRTVPGKGVPIEP